MRSFIIKFKTSNVKLFSFEFNLLRTVSLKFKKDLDLIRSSRICSYKVYILFLIILDAFLANQKTCFLKIKSPDLIYLYNFYK